MSAIPQIPQIPVGLPNFNDPAEAAMAWALKVRELQEFKESYGRGDEFYSVNCLLNDKNIYNLKTDDLSARMIGIFLTKIVNTLSKLISFLMRMI